MRNRKDSLWDVLSNHPAHLYHSAGAKRPELITTGQLKIPLLEGNAQEILSVLVLKSSPVNNSSGMGAFWGQGGAAPIKHPASVVQVGAALTLIRGMTDWPDYRSGNDSEEAPTPRAGSRAQLQE